MLKDNYTWGKVNPCLSTFHHKTTDTTHPPLDVPNFFRSPLFSQKLHRDLPPTPLYAFGESQETATFPGPTLEARTNVETEIEWGNYLMDPELMIAGDHAMIWDGVPMSESTLQQLRIDG